MNKTLNAAETAESWCYIQRALDVRSPKRAVDWVMKRPATVLTMSPVLMGRLWLEIPKLRVKASRKRFVVYLTVNLSSELSLCCSAEIWTLIGYSKAFPVIFLCCPFKMSLSFSKLLKSCVPLCLFVLSLCLDPDQFASQIWETSSRPAADYDE